MTLSCAVHGGNRTLQDRLWNRHADLTDLCLEHGKCEHRFCARWPSMTPSVKFSTVKYTRRILCPSAWQLETWLGSLTQVLCRFYDDIVLWTLYLVKCCKNKYGLRWDTEFVGDRLRNEEALQGVKAERNILHAIGRSKDKWLRHILHRNCLLNHTIVAKTEGKTVVTKWRGKRCRQLEDDLNTLRTGSFKLFKRSFPGSFLTILTL